MSANLENSAMATGLEMVSFYFIPKKGSAKECSDYRTFALISHASNIVLKIFQVRLQQYVNQEFPDIRAEFRRGRVHFGRLRSWTCQCVVRRATSSKKVQVP